MATIKIDDEDMKIIEMLSKDSRIPYRMMAEQLGMSPMTMLKRVKKLGIIRAFTIALVEPQSPNYKEA
ncbi:MAG TPA: AsnC family transcriptional regulator [Candidatus Bathyarchaeota archaeon]|nr:AsnC family transcriptional regulator [Candidatus Bathyarchaeota archaeon]